MLKPIRGSVWKSRVNSFIGFMFVGSCAIWAGLVIVQAAWGTNPLANAFIAIVQAETQLPMQTP
jgi:hypothetical protein